MIIDPDFDDDFGPETTLAQILRRPLELAEEQLHRERISHSNSLIKSLTMEKVRAKRKGLGKLDFTRRSTEPCRR